MSRVLCKPDFACYEVSMSMKKNPHAAALSKLGAKKGGKARWNGISPEEKSAILRRAAEARWAKAKKGRKGGENRD